MMVLSLLKFICIILNVDVPLIFIVIGFILFVCDNNFIHVLLIIFL